MNMKDQEDLIGKGLAWAPAIQHPLDRMYLKKIEGIPLMPKIMGWVVDRQREETEALFSGDGVLVTDSSCPEADAAFREACEALDLDRNNFRLFVTADAVLDARTTGSGIPTVIASRGLVNACSKEELKFVLGHELGHYVCGHVRCHALARYLQAGASFTPAWIAAASIGPVLMSWSRCSEISADRAGLLAGKDFEAACGVLLKLGGFPHLKGMPEKPSRVLAGQYIDYMAQMGNFSMLHRLWREVKHGLEATHPRVVERFVALDEWRDLGYYDELAETTPDERIRIAETIGNDWLRHELDLALVATTADYAEKNCGVSRDVSLPLLRRAFLRDGSLKGTALDSLVYAEMGVEKKKDDSLSYDLILWFLQNGSEPLKVTIPVEYSPDRDFAPESIRHQFIESRQDRLSVLVYNPKS